ncbi:mitotic interactor and substrate of PLK1 [Rhinophrynus dorsalis]
MFKYPSPWQVLCSGLERRDQVSANVIGTSLSYTELPTTNTPKQLVTISAEQKSVNSPEDQLNGLPEELVKKELDYQELNSFDIKEIGANEGQARDVTKLYETCTEENKVTETFEVRTTQQKVLLGQDITFISKDKQNIPKLNSSVQDSAMDRVTRNPIFSLSSATSIESHQEEPDHENSTTEKSYSLVVSIKSNNVWVPPADRESRLRLLKESNRFDVRAYRPETSPTKLFLDFDEAEDEIRPRSREFTPEKVMELEAQRRDIIKRQGQRKSLDTEQLNTLQNETDASLLGTNVNGMDTGPNTEQINFEAARQQFVMLEMKRNSLPISPQPQIRSSRFSSGSVFEKDCNSPVQKMYDSSRIGQEVVSHTSNSPGTPEVTTKDRNSIQLSKQFFWEMPVDDLDSGAEEKIREINNEVPSQLMSEETENIPNLSNETPIEREIRLALEREECLRRERGIQSGVETNKMVEIFKNPVRTLPLDSQLKQKSKDRARTSFFLQREIEKETKREEDLRNEGKVAGLYDKGNPQELDERRKLFEQPDEVPVKPQKVGKQSTFKGSMDDLSTGEEISQVDYGQNIENNNWSVLDAPQPYSIRTNWKPTPINPYRYRRQSLENVLDYKTPLQSSSEAGNEVSADIQILRKENFHIRPWKVSLKVKGDVEVDSKHKQTQKTKEDEIPEVIYSMNRLRPSVSNVIEQEIQQSLERDRELREQRRKSEIPPITTPTDSKSSTSVNGYSQYGRPSPSSGISRQWFPATPGGTPSDAATSNSVSPVQMFKLKRYPRFDISEPDSDKLRRHREDYWYAGINPSDEVNTEIVESTRVNRHKNTMALRWEAGMYTNEQSD